MAVANGGFIPTTLAPPAFSPQALVRVKINLYMADEESKISDTPVNGDGVKEGDSAKVTEEESEEESLVYDRPRSASSEESGTLRF